MPKGYGIDQTYEKLKMSPPPTPSHGIDPKNKPGLENRPRSKADMPSVEMCKDHHTVDRGASADKVMDETIHRAMKGHQVL